MKYLALALALALVAALAFASLWLLGAGDADDEPSVAAPDAHAALPVDDGAAPSLGAPSPATLGAGSERLALDGAGEAAAAIDVGTGSDAPAARFELTGRLVDPDGAPLTGGVAHVGFGRTWGAPLTAEEVRVAEVEGRHAPAGADGRFTLAGLLPERGRRTLIAEAGGFRTRVERSLHDRSEVRGRQVLTLRPGANDVGDLVLRPAGAVVGRAVDDTGAPLAGVAVKLGQHAAAYFADAPHRALSGVDGRFRLAHQPPGVQSFVLHREGLLTVVVSDVTVAAGRELELGDTVLAPAPSFAGRVTDADGEPLEGAQVEAMTDGWASHGSARTDADGHFVLHVTEAVAHRFEVRKRDYRTEGVAGTGRSVEHGSGPVAIVLRPATVTEFRVVDAESGAPAKLRLGLVPLDEREPSIDLGSTDADGRVLGHARAVGPCRVFGRVAQGPWLPHPDVVVTPGAPRTAVAFGLAGLTFRLPSSIDATAAQVVTVRLESDAYEPREQALHTFQHRADDPAVVTIAGCAPGPQRLAVRVEGDFREHDFERAVLWESSAPFDIELRAGATETIDLEGR